MEPSEALGRRGVIIPAVLIMMAVFAVLSISLLFTSSSDYSQAALVAYGLRANQLALAAIDEARTIVYDKVNRIDPAPEWKLELYRRIVAKAGDSVRPADTGTVFDQSIKDLLRNTNELAAQSGGGRIDSASVEFFGFRRIGYTTGGQYLDDQIYYRDPDGKLEFPGGPQGPREYQGYYRIRVQTSFGDRHPVRRTISTVSDVKVVAAVPPAREFALMSNRSAAPAGTDFQMNDLNRGGAFMVFGHGRGRVFVRGPHVVDLEDMPNGTGGDEPQVCTSYFRREWWGWSMVPATRDGVLERAGVFLINFAVDPARPEDTSRQRPMIGFVRTLAQIFGDDPGWYILDGQSWYAGTRMWAGPGTTAFSIVGNPAAGNWSLYRGNLTRRDGADRSVQQPVDVTSTPYRLYPNGQVAIDVPPGDEEGRWALEPEGALLGHCNVVNYDYDRWEICFCILGCCVMWESYGLQHGGDAHVKYGCYWEKRYTQDYWSRLGSDLMRYALRGLTLGVILAPGGLLGGALLQMLGHQILNALWSVDSVLTNPELAPAQLRGLIVPDTRPTMRAVTRWYPRLGDLRSVRRGPNPADPLVVDGMLGFDDLSTDRPIIYQGKGTVYSNRRRPHQLEAPIIPMNRAGTNPRDYLTIEAEFGGREAQQADSMLTFRSTLGQATVIASVASMQGVKAPNGQQVTILGNLVCGYINKGHIPGGARVHVDYDRDVLGHPIPPQAFTDGTWHQVALSHRLAGWYDR